MTAAISVIPERILESRLDLTTGSLATMRGNRAVVRKPLNRKGIRHSECPLYDECLTYAARRVWKCWSCGTCPNHLLANVHLRLRFIEQYYHPLAKIYPEFRRKYQPFMALLS